MYKVFSGQDVSNCLLYCLIVERRLLGIYGDGKILNSLFMFRNALSVYKAWHINRNAKIQFLGRWSGSLGSGQLPVCNYSTTCIFLFF
jgi:hypothetical protein